MEEASIAFSVDAAEASDEEDDQLRKAELHQLLTEQLQDDLLDDSVSTVTTEGGMADSTLLGDEVGVSLDRVISPNQSCDLAPSLHDTDEGRDEGLSTGNVCLTSHDPDAVQHHMDPSQVAPSGDMVAPSGDMVAPSGDMHPLPSPPAPVVGVGGGPTEMSDVFSGTAQAYSLLQAPFRTDHTPSMMTCPVGPVELSPQAGQCHPAELSLTVEVDQGVCHAHQDVTHVTRGRGQLEVLYGARCRQVEVLSQQLQASREEGERQMRVLRHEKSQLEGRLVEAVEGQRVLEEQVQLVTQQLTSAAGAEREDVCAMLHPPSGGSGDLAERLVDLSTQREDLQYQLSCCQGQLETQVLRAESAKVKVSSLSEQLSSVATEATGLRAEVGRLVAEAGRERESAEQDKREALEKCRTACLQLHEDATERMKEVTAAEKHSMVQEHSQQIASLQKELCSVQEEYVRVCGEKDRLEAAQAKMTEQGELEWQRRADQLVQSAVEREKTEWVREREREVKHREEQGERQRDVEMREAVERAREERRQTLAWESRQSVERALSSARQQWQARLSAEKEAIRMEAARERGTAITSAVATAREQWQAAQETAIQKAVEEAKRDCPHSTSESVLTVSQVQCMLQATIASVKSDVRRMLQEVLRIGEEREHHAVARSRLATAEEMKAHYLNCLHMMVNTASLSGAGRGEGDTDLQGQGQEGNVRPQVRDGYHGKGLSPTTITSTRDRGQKEGGEREGGVINYVHKVNPLATESTGVGMATASQNSKTTAKAQRVGTDRTAASSKKPRGAGLRGRNVAPQKGSVGLWDKRTKSRTAASTSRQGQRSHNQT